MSVTVAQATTLLENILFESPTLAAANAPGWASLSALNSSYATVAGLSAAIAASPEESIAAQVVRYYEGALGRAPGGSEIQYYVNIAEAGLTPGQISIGATAVAQSTWNTIANDFASSPEFAFNSASSSSVVTLLYLNILGRTPSASEIAYYTAQQSAGFGTSTLVQEFTNSPEYQTKVDSSIQTLLGTYGATVEGGTTPTTIGTTPVTVPTTTFTLTSGPDTATANIFNATLGTSATTTATLQGFDALTGAGGSGNVLNIYDVAGNTVDIALPLGLTLTNIQTVTISTAKAVGDLNATTVLDVSGYTSVTQLTTTSTGADGDDINAGATQSVTTTTLGAGGLTLTGGLNDTSTTSGGVITISGATGSTTLTASAQGGNNIAIDGGTSVTLTATGVTTGGTIIVGGTTKPTGAIAVTVTDKETGSFTSDAITVKGGTTVSVTENMAATAAVVAAGTTTGTIGTIAVTGGSLTTSVSVAETATTPATAPVAGSTGVVGVAALAAAPGVTAVTLVSAVPSVSTSTAAYGVTDGAINITDGSTALNTIKSVSVTNGGTIVITERALTSLSVTGTDTSVTLTNAAVTVTNPTLALTLSAAKVGTFTDTDNEISTLNVTTAGTKKSTLTAITAETGLTNLNVAGTQTLVWGTALSPANFAALTAIAVSGAAGFSGDISAQPYTVVGTVTTGSTIFTTTSSGAVTLTLDSAAADEQTFTGSTGNDVITIGTDVYKYAPVAAGTGTANELILTATGASSYTAAKTGTYATGFQILGLHGSVNGGTVALSQWATGSTYKTINVEASGTVAVSGFGGNTINFNDVTTPGDASLTVTTSNNLGASTAFTINIADANGGAVAGTAKQTIGVLSLADGNATGIGTLNIVNSNTGFDTADTITTLTDNGLSTINLSGTGGLLIVGLNEATTQATSLTLNNTSSGAAGLTITNLTDANLGSLTFGGTGGVYISTLTDSASFLSLTDSGSGTISVNKIVSAATGNSVITIGSGITLGASTTTANEASIGLQDSATSGVTISAGSDNKHLTLVLTAGASVGNTDTITVGNSNDYISDATTTGTVAITVGTGSNFIVLAGAAGGTNSATLTEGTHSAASGIDVVTVGLAGAAFATTPGLVVTGAVTGDKFITGDVGTTLTGFTLATAGSTAALTITAVEAAAATGAAVGYTAYAQFGGNTYVAETHVSGGNTAASITLVELVGTHTFVSSGAASGAFTLLT